MSEYRLVANFDGVQRTSDGAFIPPDPANRDYQAFLAWIAAGNTPLPAPVPPPQVELPDTNPTTLAADPIGEMDATTVRWVDDRIAQALIQTMKGR